jgi:anti-sigma28 factor (negative regulator of flagellin synthesis)
MKVSDINSVVAPERVAAQQSSSTGALGARDKVSVDATRGAQASVSSARRSAGADRAGRLQQLEVSVRSGTYAPDPSRVAEQILSDAEVDARLQATMAQ